MEWKPKKIFQQRAEWVGHCGGRPRNMSTCLFTEFGQSKSTIGPQGCGWVPTRHVIATISNVLESLERQGFPEVLRSTPRLIALMLYHVI
jgi:hypothetical protein